MRGLFPEKLPEYNTGLHFLIKSSFSRKMGNGLQTGI